MASDAYQMIIAFQIGYSCQKFKILSRSTKVLSVILFVLIVDQALKIWVKTSMVYGGQIPLIGNWCMLHFVENPGMAFGIEFGGEWGKLGLSIFRIVAVIFLSFYLRMLIKSKVPLGFLISAGLILAGAIGNIIDSAFYGLIFSASSTHYSGLAEFMPEGGGYAGFLHGKVVDMFHLPLYTGYFPDSFPFWGGERFEFFRPVFNVADMSITIGVATIIIFYRGVFNSEELNPSDPKTTATATAVATTNGTTDATSTESTENSTPNIDEEIGKKSTE